MLDPTAGTGVVDRIYRRVPLGAARVAVATFAGAFVAVGVALRQDGVGLTRRYWFVFASCGLAVGLAGGVLLAVLERRAARGAPPPLVWTVVSRVSLVLLQLVGLALVLCLFWLMFRVVRENHLWGF